MQRIQVEVVPANVNEDGYYTVTLRTGISLASPKTNLALEFDESIGLADAIHRLADHFHSESTLTLTEGGGSSIESSPVDTEDEDDEDTYW